MIWYLEGKETYSFIQSKCCNDDNNLRKQATKHFSHEGIARLAGPGHVADGPGGQNSYRGEVAERESQNYRQTPDTNDDTGGGLRRQTRLQRVDDGHVPKGQRSVSLSINLLTYTKETKLSLTTLFKPFWKVYFITLISIYLGSRTKVKQLLLGNIHGWWWNTHLSGSHKHHSHSGLSSCSCTSHIHMKGFRIGVKGWSNLASQSPGWTSCVWPTTSCFIYASAARHTRVHYFDNPGWEQTQHWVRNIVAWLSKLR